MALPFEGGVAAALCHRTPSWRPPIRVLQLVLADLRTAASGVQTAARGMIIFERAYSSLEG
jgi:hypothetical protein